MLLLETKDKKTKKNENGQNPKAQAKVKLFE